MDIQSISDAVTKIPSELPAWAGWALPVLAEGVMRMWPTAKPKSLLLVIAAAGHALSAGLEKISSLADKIAQNLKDDPTA